MKKNLPNIIIGSGFIASNFNNKRKALEELNVCIYAAGVSNSQTTDNVILSREIERITEFSKELKEEQKLVYVSTCSIDDPSRNNNPYVKNKLYIENFIENNFKKYLIIRLPEVVGKNENKTTLINFLYGKINKEKKFEIWKKAKRNIIDIDDVILITISLLKNKSLNNTKVNIANPISYFINEIVKVFESLTGRKANYILTDKGNDNWEINTSNIDKIINTSKIKFDKNYLINVLKKYYF